MVARIKILLGGVSHNALLDPQAAAKYLAVFVRAPYAAEHLAVFVSIFQLAYARWLHVVWLECLQV